MTVEDKRSSVLKDEERSSSLEKSPIFIEISDLKHDTWKKVRDLAASGSDVNKVGDYNEGYLHVLSAPRPDDLMPHAIAVVYVLAAAGIDVNAKDLEGNTALHVCALNDIHHSFVNALIKVGVDPCLLNSQDRDAMDLVCDPRTRNVLEFLDPGLWRAAVNGEQDRVEKMILSWCKVAQTLNGRKMVKVAEEAGRTGIVSCLKKNRDSSRFIHAALAGKVDEMKDLMKKESVDPHTKDWSYMHENGSRVAWPLLAECIRLGLFDSARILMKKVSVNTIIEPQADTKIPLYIWALDHVAEADHNFKVALFKKADLSFATNQLDLMFKMWRKNFPSSVLAQLVANGWDISQRDDNGYSLRDLIFMDTFDLKKDQINSHLLFVDNIILDMARKDRKSDLEKLALNGYEYINVYDERGTSTLQIARKDKNKDTVKFLQRLPKLQKDAFKLHGYIQVANLQAARQLLDSHMVRVRDRAGRNALHKAVLFEKRFITKHITDKYSDVINLQDSHGRTALHYACCLQYGEDLVEALIQKGAYEAIKDENGNTPMDCKLQSSQEFIERERVKDYGSHVCLLERYMALCGAIQDADMDRLKELVDSLFQFNLNDFAYRLEHGRVRGLEYRPLVFLCLDCAQYDMCFYLLERGADCRVAAEVHTENGQQQIVPLIDYAAMMDRYDLVDAIKMKLEMYNRDPESAPVPSSRNGSGRSQTMSDRSTALSHYQRMDTDESLAGKKQQIDHSAHSNDSDNKKNRATSSACIIL